jgi:hypothetical protein
MQGWPDDEQIETLVFFEPGQPGLQPVPEPPRVRPHARASALEPEDRFTIPSIASRNVYVHSDLYAAVGETVRTPRHVVLTPWQLAIAGACVLAGIIVGCAIALTGHTTIAAASSALPVRTAPVLTATPIEQTLPAPPVAGPVTPTATLRVESSPPGATVTLVDGTATTLVGTTPVDSNIDPTRDYDLLVTMANHPSRIEHIGPTSDRHVTIALDAVDNRPATPRH